MWPHTVREPLESNELAAARRAWTGSSRWRCIVVYQSSNETAEAGSCQPTVNGLPTKIGMEPDDGYCEETPNDDDDTDCAYHCYDTL